MSKEHDFSTNQSQLYHVSGGDNEMAVTAKTSHAAVKIFRDNYPNYTGKISVTNYQSHE